MFFPHGGRERINPGCWRSLQRPTRLRPLFSRAGHHRVPELPFNFESGNPPLLRFGSLQRSLAALRCPRRPAPDDPASAFSSRDDPRVRVRLVRPCGFSATQRHRSRFEPPDAAAPRGHSPDDFFIPAFRARWWGCLRPGQALSPGGAHGIHFPSQFFSGRSGVIAFRLSRTCMSFSPRTSRGLWRSVFCPANGPLIGKAKTRSGGVRLPGFDPGNQPCHSQSAAPL